MTRETVYIESTIPSYLTAEPSNDITNLNRQYQTKKWRDNDRRNFDLVTSEVVVEEIETGSSKHAPKRLEIIKNIPLLFVSEEIHTLVKTYRQQFNFPKKIEPDMYHIAFSVCHNRDFLLTWNCAHIANSHFKKQFEKFNLSKNLFTPELCTPDTLIEMKFEEE